MISGTHSDSFRHSLDPETMSSLQETIMQSQLQYNHNAAQQNSYMHQNVDFAKVFDNDDLNQLFYESFKHDSLEPTPLNGGGGASGLTKSNSLDGLALLCNSSFGALNAAFHPQNFSSSNVSVQAQTNSNGAAASSNPFVNVMLIVDPATQKVICPRQTLQYQVGQKTENHVVGPAVLDNVNSVQNIDIQQLLQQGVFSNAGSLFASAQQHHHSITPPPSMTSGDSSNGSSSSKTLLKMPGSAPEELPPLRALSAYNFFFRDERDRVLNGGSLDLNDSKANALLQEHWGRDRAKKRRHRKTHGKIDFTTLSKLISTRWKELPECDKEFYRQVAAKDWERYQRELGEHKSKAHQAHLERHHQAVVENHLAVIA